MEEMVLRNGYMKPIFKLIVLNGEIEENYWYLTGFGHGCYSILQRTLTLMSHTYICQNCTQKEAEIL